MRSSYDGFKVLSTPAYSSFFNSQETVWSVLKHELFQHFARLNRDLKKQVQFEAEVDMICDRFRIYHPNEEFFLACRGELEKYV